MWDKKFWALQQQTNRILENPGALSRGGGGEGRQAKYTEQQNQRDDCLQSVRTLNSPICYTVSFVSP